MLIIKHPVWLSDIKTLDDALKMISALGVITARSIQAEKVIAAIQQPFLKLLKDTESKQKKRALYLIWNSPMMTAGHDTFINEMILKLPEQVYLPIDIDKIKQEELKEEEELDIQEKQFDSKRESSNYEET